MFNKKKNYFSLYGSTRFDFKLFKVSTISTNCFRVWIQVSWKEQNPTMATFLVMMSTADKQINAKVILSTFRCLENE